MTARFAISVLVAAAALAGAPPALATTAHPHHVAVLAPARGQPAPTSLTAAKAIPQVAYAVIEAKRHALIPRPLTPVLPALREENAHVDYDIPNGCEPSFGSGITSQVCRLGDPTAKRVVVVFGDSHAQMWTPALVTIAAQQHFALVPLVKPGCFITRVWQNRPGWPCHSWYEWALAKARALHPTVTIVSALLSQFTTPSSIATATEDLRTVLTAVPHGVLLADPPGQSQMPADCLASPNATMYGCSTPLSAAYLTLLRSLAAMARSAGRPAIPTEQWFCADAICPMVIGGIVTDHSLDHLTPEYSLALAPVLGPEVKRVLG